MSILNKLAFALNSKVQEPNRQVAKYIVEAGGSEEIDELVNFVRSNPIQRAQSDAVLALAYIGEHAPNLLTPQVNFLLENLTSPINRVVFGSMIGLAHIAHLEQERLFSELPHIISVMDEGTVVTRDHGYRIMIELYSDKRFQMDTFPLIREQLMKAPSNQLGQYTERLIQVLNNSHLDSLIEVLEERRNDIHNEHHINRLNKNLKKLYKKL